MQPSSHKQFLIFTLLVLGLGIISPPTGRGDIFSWTDADGVRHFSNKTPRDNATEVRRSQEIAYDAAGDQRNQEDERRYFEQRALQNTLRRLEQTERALKESLERARAAEARNDAWSAPNHTGDVYDVDKPYYQGAYYGGADARYYADYGRKHRGVRDRRHGQRHRGPRNDRDKRWKGRHHGDDQKEARMRRHERIERQRLSKRERGVRSGLNRTVRALPSPYYMGSRPVYSGRSGAFYEPRRGGHYHRFYRRGGGGFRGGGRARIGF
jgi:hypothetical protein